MKLPTLSEFDYWVESLHPIIRYPLMAIIITVTIAVLVGGYIALGVCVIWGVINYHDPLALTVGIICFIIGTSICLYINDHPD